MTLFAPNKIAYLMPSTTGHKIAGLCTTSRQGTEWYQMGTQEACATCHAEGCCFGIDKFHYVETK